MKLLFEPVSEVYWRSVDYLMRRYKYPLDEVRGNYYLKCSISGSPCSLCRGPIESPTCAHGLFSVSGLSGPDAAHLLVIGQYEDRILAEQNVLNQTGEPPWGPPAGSKKYIDQNGQERDPLDSDLFDPFDGFPDDVNTDVTPESIDMRAKISEAERRVSLAGRGTLDIKVWDEERIAAGKGKRGKLAKRCALQDYSWHLYKSLDNPSAEEMHERLRTNYIMSVLQTPCINEERRQELENALLGE